MECMTSGNMLLTASPNGANVNHDGTTFADEDLEMLTNRNQWSDDLFGEY